MFHFPLHVHSLYLILSLLLSESWLWLLVAWTSYAGRVCVGLYAVSSRALSVGPTMAPVALAVRTNHVMPSLKLLKRERRKLLRHAASSPTTRLNRYYHHETDTETVMIISTHFAACYNNDNILLNILL